jgi:hypothetical protein
LSCVDGVRLALTINESSLDSNKAFDNFRAFINAINAVDLNFLAERLGNECESGWGILQFAVRYEPDSIELLLSKINTLPEDLKANMLQHRGEMPITALQLGEIYHPTHEGLRSSEVLAQTDPLLLLLAALFLMETTAGAHTLHPLVTP